MSKIRLEEIEKTTFKLYLGLYSNEALKILDLAFKDSDTDFFIMCDVNHYFITRADDGELTLMIDLAITMDPRLSGYWFNKDRFIEWKYKRCPLQFVEQDSSKIFLKNENCGHQNCNRECIRGLAIDILVNIVEHANGKYSGLENEFESLLAYLYDEEHEGDIVGKPISDPFRLASLTALRKEINDTASKLELLSHEYDRFMGRAKNNK